MDLSQQPRVRQYLRHTRAVDANTVLALLPSAPFYSLRTYIAYMNKYIARFRRDPSPTLLNVTTRSSDVALYDVRDIGLCSRMKVLDILQMIADELTTAHAETLYKRTFDDTTNTRFNALVTAYVHVQLHRKKGTFLYSAVSSP